MYTTVLIIVFGLFGNSGVSSLSVPFQTMEQCMKAKADIEKQSQNSRQHTVKGGILSSGCYEQGRTK